MLCRLSFLLLFLLWASGVQAQGPEIFPSAGAPEPAERHNIAAANAGLTGAFTLLRGVFSGQVKDVGSGVEVFALGAAAGLGFYEAKALIGRGHPMLGTALAYGSASVAESAAEGEHPLGTLRLGPGPLDVRVRTPFYSGEAKAVSVEMSPSGIAALIALPVLGYTPELCGFTLCYRSSEPIGGFRRNGRVLGRAILLGPEADAEVETHELIHYVQGLQVGAVTPYPTASTLRLWSAPTLAGRVQADLRIEWLYAAFAVSSLVVEYDERWSEIEAHTLDAPAEQACGSLFCLE